STYSSNDTPPTGYYTLSLHDALPILDTMSAWPEAIISSATSGMLMRFEAITGMPTSFFTCAVASTNAARGTEVTMVGTRASCQRSEEHTSELQSRENLVCRLLLEKKK